MRRTITAIVILIASFSIGVFSHFFVKNVCSQAISGVDEILENAVTQDKEGVNQLCVQLNTIWNKKVFLLNILIGREYTNEVSKHFNKIVYFFIFDVILKMVYPVKKALKIRIFYNSVSICLLMI